jgi:hypothetical protein
MVEGVADIMLLIFYELQLMVVTSVHENMLKDIE